MSFGLIVKEGSLRLILLPYFTLKFSFTQLHRPLSFFIKAFLMVREDSLTI